MAESGLQCLGSGRQSGSLVSGLAALYREQQHCDLMLVCRGGVKLQAHRVILAASSEYFAQILQNIQAGQETIVVLGDVESEVMAAILEFIYTGTVSISNIDLQHFLSTADTLQIKDLQTEVNRYRRENETQLLEAVADGTQSLLDKVNTETHLDIIKHEITEGDQGESEEGLVSSPPRLDTDPPVLVAAPQLSGAQEMLRRRILGWGARRGAAPLPSQETVGSKKPCVCTMCGARFSYRNQLTDHKQSSHKQ